MANTSKLDVILDLQNNLSKDMQKAIGQVDKLGAHAKTTQSKMGGLGKSLVALGGIVSIGLITKKMYDLGKTSVKVFTEFEKGMSNVSTLVDTSTESMEDMGKELLDIAKKSPAAINDLTKSLYDIRSAGTAASEAMDVLRGSVELSAAGLSSTAEATDIMTSAANAFATEALSGTQIANILFKTVKAGKTTISQLAQGFGATAPIVQAAGVSLAEFQAATAAITTLGTPAAQAQNQIRAAVVSLQNPTKELGMIYDKLGVDSIGGLLEKYGDLGTGLKAVKEEADNQDLSMKKVMGRVEGAAAATALATSVNKVYTGTLKDMTEGTDALREAYLKQLTTFDSASKIFTNNIKAIGIQIGQKLAPAITKVMASIVLWLEANSEAVEKFTDNFVDGLVMVGKGLINTGKFLYDYLINPIIVALKQPVVKWIVGIVGGIKLLSLAFIALQATNPIGWITLAVSGAIIAITALVKHWDKVTKFMGDSMRNAKTIVMGVLGALGNGFLNYAKSILTFFNNLGTAIRTALTGGLGEIPKVMQQLGSDLKNTLSGIQSDVADSIEKTKVYDLSVKKDVAVNETKTQTLAINDQTQADDTTQSIDDNTQAIAADKDFYSQKLANTEAYYAAKKEFDEISKADEFAAFAENSQMEYEQEMERLNALSQVKLDNDTKNAEHQATVDAAKLAAETKYTQKKQVVKDNADKIEKANKTKFFDDMFKTTNKYFGDVTNAIGAWQELGIHQSKETANAMKAIQIGQTIVSTASGIMQVWSDTSLPGWPAKLAASISLAAVGAANIAKISGVKFADGTTEVMGSGTGDVVPAMLTPGEMVIPKTMAQGIRAGDVTLGGSRQSSAASSDVSGAVTYQFNFDGANFYGEMTLEKIKDLFSQAGEAISDGLMPALPQGA